MKTLLQSLVETPSPSGYEAQVREVIRQAVVDLADDVHIDALGNLIARKAPSGSSDAGEGDRECLVIMLSAHMYEIGIMVTHVDENGFIRFTNLGGVRTLNCVGGRVRFMNGLIGVIGVERLTDPNKVPTIEQLYIDVGIEERKECPVRVGDVAVFERPFVDLGKRVISKAMDDRVGVAVVAPRKPTSS